MDLDSSIYPGGFYSLLRFLERKEVPYNDPLRVLPAMDVDLQHLNQTIVCAKQLPDELEDRQDALRKHNALTVEFDGQNQLHLLHAMLISLLRRQNAPELAQQLFLRIWREMGKDLAQDLSVRWLISAATTFADHGETMDQRLGGQGLSMLYDLIKLHDSERRLSGRPNDMGFPQIKGRPRHELSFDMAAYSLQRGDLDKNMLARLWRYAENDPTLRPLGFRMLNMVMTDKRSVFGRIQRYKKKARNDFSLT